jgi:hypothetical protein
MYKPWSSTTEAPPPPLDRPVWVDLVQLYGEPDPSTAPAAEDPVPGGYLQVSGRVPGVLKRWARATDGRWFGCRPGLKLTVGRSACRMAARCSLPRRPAAGPIATADLLWHRPQRAEAPPGGREHVATGLPVPIRFELPSGWQLVDPDDVGVPEAALAAVLTETLGSDFTPSLVILGGVFHEEITEDRLVDIADEAVRMARNSVRDVELALRQNTGTAEFPSLVQVLKVFEDVDGPGGRGVGTPLRVLRRWQWRLGSVAHQKVQFQLYEVMGRWERPRRGCLIVRANLVCTADQYDTMAEACRTIFQSLEPDVPPPSTLPVPIRFDLPDGWEPVSGDMSDAAFTAMKTAAHDLGVTPTIRLRGQFRDDGPVGMADEFLRDLLESERDQVVASRRYRDSPEHPQLIQTVSDCHIVDGVPREVVNLQAYLPVGRSADQRGAAVVQAVLICGDNQVESMLDDFHSFLDSIAPESPTTS